MENSLESILEKAHQAAAAIKAPAARCSALNQIAALYAQHNLASQAGALVTESLQAVENVKYPHEKARCLAGGAVVLARLGQTGEARSQFSRAVRLARAAETPAQTVEALLRLAAGYLEAALSEESIRLLDELVPLVKDPASEVDSAAELVNIAELLDDAGQKEAAGQVLADALTLAQKLPDYWFRLERLLEIADTYASSGAADPARPVLTEAAGLIEKIDEYSRPYFLLRLAEVYINLGRAAEAASVLQTIAPVVKAGDNAYEKVGGLIEIAQKYLEIDQKAAALAILEDADRLVSEITNTRELIAIQIELAEWLDEAGQPARAAEIAVRARSGCCELADRESSLFCLGNLALLYVYLKEPATATQMIDEIQRIVQETPAKTAGLGAIGLELAAEGQPALALRLAAVIREPEILVNLYAGITAALFPPAA